MPPKKSERDAAVEKIIDLLAEHIETMTPEQAKALSADFKSFSRQLRRPSAPSPLEKHPRSTEEALSSAKKAARRRVSRGHKRTT